MLVKPSFISCSCDRGQEQSKRCGCPLQNSVWRTPQCPRGEGACPRESVWRTPQCQKRQECGCGCQRMLNQDPRPNPCRSPREETRPCVPQTPCRKQSLAAVYAPHQGFEKLYDPRKALCSGTVFSELDKPFLGCGRGK